MVAARLTNRERRADGDSDRDSHGLAGRHRDTVRDPGRDRVRHGHAGRRYAGLERRALGGGTLGGSGPATRVVPAAPVPRATVSIRAIVDRAARTRGVLVRVHSSAGGRVEIQLVSGRTVVGRKTVTLRPGVQRQVRVKLTRAATRVVARVGATTSRAVSARRGCRARAARR